jgi:hypothetical protein
LQAVAAAAAVVAAALAEVVGFLLGAVAAVAVGHLKRQTPLEVLVIMPEAAERFRLQEVAVVERSTQEAEAGAVIGAQWDSWVVLELQVPVVAEALAAELCLVTATSHGLPLARV